MSLTLHYDFKSNPSLNPVAGKGPVLDITRATEATMVDADGYLRQVQDGEPRFDGAGFQHNLLVESVDLSDAQWVLQNMTREQDTLDVTDPFGGNTATKIIDDAVNSRHNIADNLASRAFRTDGTEVYSVYAKAGTADFLYLGSHSTASVSLRSAWFDLANGVLGTAGGATQGASMTHVGNGWYRCSIAGTGSTSSLYTIGMSEADNTEAYVGSSSSIYVWHPQDEYVPDGSQLPGNFVATTGAPVTNLSGANTGLLVEEARTNICLQSENLSLVWTNTRSVDAQAQGTAPDGTDTANKITDDSLTGENSVLMLQNILQATSTAYTYSCYLKADQLSWAKLSVLGNAAETIHQYFDLSLGSVGTPGADVDASFIEDVGNGWFRCGLTYTSDSVDTSVTLAIAIAEADGDDLVTRDGTSSIFVWGAQLEAGAFPTSYIPTVAASVTRNADVITVADVTWYDEDQGTLYCDTTCEHAKSVDSYAVAIGAASNSQFALGYRDAGGAAIYSIHETASGTDGASVISSPAYIAGTRYKIAAGVQLNDLQAYANGVAGNAVATVTVPASTTFNAIAVGCNGAGAGAENWNGHIAEIRYYDERLTNAQLEDMSNGIFPGGGGGGRIRKANDAALWNYQQRLKREDEEALKLIRQILN